MERYTSSVASTRRVGRVIDSTGDQTGNRRVDDPTCKCRASLRTRPLVVLAAVALCAAVILVLNRQHPHTVLLHPASDQPPRRIAEERAALDARAERQRRWREIVQPRLQECAAATARAADESVGLLTRFIAERKAGSHAFAESMLGLRAKWTFVRSKLPGWLGGNETAHAQYLAERFRETIFSNEEVRMTLENVVVSYLSTVQARENELLVRTRADLADIPLPEFPAVQSDATFQAEFDRLLRDAAPTIQTDVGVDVARELTSFVMGEVAASVAVRVMTAVATRLGVSAGILGAGASASWATFGLSLVAGIIVDQVVSWIIDAVRDPVGQLETRVNEMLDQLSREIVDGAPGDPGLRGRLVAIDRQRAAIRSEALRRLVLGEE